MLEKLKKRQSGFTLIEIVLVLAIAGLIMVIVFLAVQGAQRARRDTQRKNDAGRMIAALEQYASNNTGSYPATGAFASTMSTYMNNDKDPLSGTTYNYGTATAPTSSASAGVTYALAGRTVTVCINLETGGTSCFNN